jgi:site-specific recombinase XerD
VAAGADPVAVQRHLGHKDVTTTLNIYAGLFPNRLEEIVVALDGIHEAAQGARASVATRG